MGTDLALAEAGTAAEMAAEESGGEMVAEEMVAEEGVAGVDSALVVMAVEEAVVEMAAAEMKVVEETAVELAAMEMAAEGVERVMEGLEEEVKHIYRMCRPRCISRAVTPNSNKLPKIWSNRMTCSGKLSCRSTQSRHMHMCKVHTVDKNLFEILPTK